MLVLLLLRSLGVMIIIGVLVLTQSRTLSTALLGPNEYRLGTAEARPSNIDDGHIGES